AASACRSPPARGRPGSAPCPGWRSRSATRGPASRRKHRSTSSRSSRACTPAAPAAQGWASPSASASPACSVPPCRSTAPSARAPPAPSGCRSTAPRHHPRKARRARPEGPRPPAGCRKAPRRQTAAGPHLADGPAGARTPDLLVANQALSQLSYRPDGRERRGRLPPPLSFVMILNLCDLRRPVNGSCRRRLRALGRRTERQLDRFGLGRRRRGRRVAPPPCELDVHHGDHLFIRQPAVVPQDGERVPRASRAVPASRSRCAALVGDHAPRPAPPHHRASGEILAQLDQTVVAEFAEFRAQLGERLLAMILGVALDGVLHGRLLSPPPNSTTSVSVRRSRAEERASRPPSTWNRSAPSGRKTTPTGSRRPSASAEHSIVRTTQ